MNSNSKTFYENNFNLIRLFAAAQVAHGHLVTIFQLETTWYHAAILKFFAFFPGVPIFFFISGFLISKSWETSRSWKDYAIKRIARIQPALIVSVIIAISLTFVSGYLGHLSIPVSLMDIALLFLAKITILQFFNPDYLRSYGDGVLNGSLWTITVELQFYILIPLVYYCLKAQASKVRNLIFLVVIFIGANISFDLLHDMYARTVAIKLLRMTFLPWFFMFLMGVLFQSKFDLFYKYLSGRFVWLLPIYLLSGYAGKKIGFDFGNSLNPIAFTILTCLIFSAAYTKKPIAELILGNADVSYGLYLYHMPVINYFIYLNFERSYFSAMLIAIITLLISITSWYVIENPSLVAAKKIVSKRYGNDKKQF